MRRREKKKQRRKRCEKARKEDRGEAAAEAKEKERMTGFSRSVWDVITDSAGFIWSCT